MKRYIDNYTRKEYDEIPEGKVQPTFVNGKPVSENVYNWYHNNNPEELPELIVTPQNNENYQPINVESDNNFLNRIRRQKEDERIRRANYWEGIFNVIDPTQYVGALIDKAQGERDFLPGLWYGNSGLVPDDFAEEHPYATWMFNTLGNIALGKGTTSIYKWGTTPSKIGSGAEFDVYSAPFWRHVKKVGEVPPEEVALKNSVEGTIPLKYKGIDLDGFHVYTQDKAIVPKKIPKLHNRMKLYRKIMNDGNYLPGPYDRNTRMLDFISKDGQYAITDLGEGNIGYRNWFDYLVGNPSVIDGSVLEIDDYLLLYNKKGGKLQCRRQIF